MTPTTIEVFQKAVEFGLELGVEPPDTLTFQPARNCSLEFASILKAHKLALLPLLRLPFRMEYSRILNEMLFFARDEDTRAALVEAGAEPWSVYTRDELRILVAQNRAKPFIADELCKLHEIKQTFHGRIRGSVTDNG
jgi:hypothetical protein